MARSTVSRYLNLRTFLLISIYGVIAGVCYALAYQLRFDFAVPDIHFQDFLFTLGWVVLLKLALLIGFGQIECILSYFRLPDAFRLFSAMFLANIALLVLWYLNSGQIVPPRSVVLTDFLLSFLGYCSFRVFMRIKSGRNIKDWFSGKHCENVIIIGAGEVGATLCSELSQKTQLRMRPVAFLDDDPRKVGRLIHGVLVADTVDRLVATASRYSVNKVIIAFPSASIGRVKQVTEMAHRHDIDVEIVPSLADLMSGRAMMTQLRPVQLEDLLGREPVDLNSRKIESMIKDKRILVTGAGGSIGKELVIQILAYGPKAILCVDQSEIAVFNLEQDILPVDTSIDTVTRVLDIYDYDATEAALKTFKPDVLFHAAAHKHVNLMESYPAEALKNNFIATKGLAELASKYQVERFILISTDKAINPTSVMGVSKRLAELSLAEAQSAANNTTKFIAVRFGNVLGSSGSVIPIFKRQIENGGPVTVTDPEVTRFFMTVQEAVGLVLQSATQGEGGEIFVLDMGQSMKIAEVAKQMIELSGYEPEVDIKIEYTGLRPGEKLYEEVQHKSESLKPTEHPRILRFVSDRNGIEAMEIVIENLRALFSETDPVVLKKKIKSYVPEYSPYLK